ncbi:MAG: hypothetical protein ACXWA9_13570 [Acidimicrobiia bacterium]
MSLWARGALTFVMGAGLFVLSGITTLYGGRWLIPIFGRDESWIGIIIGTVIAIGLMILGLVAVVRDLTRRDQPISN